MYYFISLVSQQCLEGGDELQIGGGSDVVVSTQLIQKPYKTTHHNSGCSHITALLLGVFPGALVEMFANGHHRFSFII